MLYGAPSSRGGEMVDAGDLKSPVVTPRAGSNPAPGTTFDNSCGFFDHDAPDGACLIHGQARAAPEEDMETSELLDTLRGLLRDVLKARFEGTAYAKLARAHGYADGYMRALLDAGLIDQESLLKLVGKERERFIAEDRADTVAA